MNLLQLFKNTLRTIYAFGWLIPSSILGILVALFSLSHRRGIDALVSSYGFLSTTTPGIKYSINGKEHLNKRPTIFIFNHQSHSELFILAKLFKKNISAIAKKELKTSAIGPILWAGGMLFIDRNKSSEAIEIFNSAKEYLNRGISFAIAPEGTRSNQYQLGQFKKGAFRLAMATKVSLTPIVFENSHDVLPKGKILLRPAIVKLHILPPIHTGHWQLINLEERIDEVRNLFVEKISAKK